MLRVEDRTRENTPIPPSGGHGASAWRAPPRGVWGAEEARVCGATRGVAGGCPVWPSNSASLAAAGWVWPGLTLRSSRLPT